MLFQADGADEDFLAVVDSVCAADAAAAAPGQQQTQQPHSLGAGAFSARASYADVQQKFSGALQQLNIEICELLLQWEEDDVLSAAVGVKNGGAPGHDAVRDTGELLQALRRVDVDLAGVDVWLAEQIDHLSTVQAEIKQIQSESSALEISWQNLTRIQALVKSILNNLQISSEEEELIVKADKHLRGILSGSVVVSASDFSAALAPLLSALGSLLRALGTSVESVAACSPEEWEHVKLSTGVLQQLQKLKSVAEGFCSIMNDVMTNIYSLILKHRVLNDLSKPTDGVLVRKYSFSTLVKEIQNVSGAESRSVSSSMGRVKNQLLSAQSTYHNVLRQFLPILDATIDLAPPNISFTLISRSRRAYAESVQQLMYAPLVKQLFKELLNAVVVCPPQTLATFPKSRASKTNSNWETNPLFVPYALCFRETLVSRPVLRVWDALVGALRLVAPVVAQERDFFAKLLSAHSQFSDGPDIEKEMFAMLHERILKLVGSSDLFGSLDIASLLVTIDRLIRGQDSDERAGLQLRSTEVSTQRGSPEVGSFVSQFVGSTPSVATNALIEARSVLYARFESFVADQIAWIQSGKGGSVVSQDSKRLVVFPLFAKFPFFLDQLNEYCCGEVFDYITRMCLSVCTSAVDWLHTTAAQSEKYHDAILIQNLAFIEVALETRRDYPFVVAGLTRLLEDCQRQRSQAETQYVLWMVRYEMPDFFALAERVASVEKRANKDELSLYIRRQDVLKVLGVMEPRGVEASIVEMRKRCDKHFASQEAQDLRLSPRLWVQLRDYLVTTVAGVDALVQASFQLNFPIRPEQVASLVDKNGFPDV